MYELERDRERERVLAFWDRVLLTDEAIKPENLMEEEIIEATKHTADDSYGNDGKEIHRMVMNLNGTNIKQNEPSIAEKTAPSMTTYLGSST